MFDISLDFMRVFNNTENQNKAVFIFSVFTNLETRQREFPSCNKNAGVL